MSVFVVMAYYSDYDDCSGEVVSVHTTTEGAQSSRNSYEQQLFDEYNPKKVWRKPHNYDIVVEEHDLHD